MSGDQLPPGGAEPLFRPFLDRGRGGVDRGGLDRGGVDRGGVDRGGLDPEPVSAGGDLRGEVRPYLITGGRTSSARVDVAMETVVAVSDRVRARRFEQTAFERARVLAECEQPRSVAEVAVRLGVPLMVALIVVGDLVEEGLLEASSTAACQADDVAFLERLIDGVSAL